MKNIFKNKDFAPIFFTSLISCLVIIFLIFGLVWHYRTSIFNSLTRAYLQDLQNQNANSKGNLTAPGFSQDSFVISAVKKTNPAVVSIIISQNVPKYEELC